MRGRYRVHKGQRDPRGMIVPGVPADERMERVPVWRQCPAFLGGAPVTYPAKLRQDSRGKTQMSHCTS